MAIVEERRPAIQVTPEQNPSPKKVEEGLIVSQSSSCQPKDEPSPVKPVSPKDAILAVASKIAAQPLPCSDPDVWGVLTAISNNARKRSQVEKEDTEYMKGTNVGTLLSLFVKVECFLLEGKDEWMTELILNSN